MSSSFNTEFHQQMTERARALLPLITSHAAENEQKRDVAPEVVAALKEAGLMQLLQPARWGGHEADPRTQFAVQNIIAEGCISTAWIQGVLGVQAFVLALMDEKAQQDVWGEDSSALMSSSFIPTGKVEVVDGGYKITGQWGFSSGCSHAQWAIVGGMVPPAAEGQPPAMKLFLVPRKDYDIIDTWQTYGLRGTGSNDLKIEAAFVPAYRSFQPAPGFLPELGLTHLPTLYRLPWLYMFTCSVSNLAIGAAQGALSAFIEVQKVRISAFTGQPTKDNPAVAVAIARLQAEIDTVQSQYHRHIERMLNAIDNNAAITMPEGLQMRTQLTGGLRRLASQVDELQLLLGGRGIRSESPLSRLWLDLMTARSHPGNDPAMIAPVFGNALLGA